MTDNKERRNMGWRDDRVNVAAEVGYHTLSLTRHCVLNCVCLPVLAIN